MLRTRPLLAAAVLALLLALPAAGAQGEDAPPETRLQVHAPPAEDHLAVGPVHELAVTVEGHCHGPGPPAQGGAYLGDRTIHLSVQAPPGIGARTPDEVVTLPRTPCEDGTVSEEASVKVVVEPSVPAFHQERIEVLARAEDAEARTEMPVQAGYKPGLEVHGPAEPVHAEAGETVHVPVAVANLANGDTRFAFEVAEAHPGLNVTAPEAVVLDTPAQETVGGAERDTTTLLRVPVEVDGDAPAGDVLPLELAVEGVYALDHSVPGLEGEVVLGVAVEGSTASAVAEAGAVPAAVGVLLGGGALAWAGRRGLG